MDEQFWNESSEELFVDKFVGREKFLAKVDEAIADVPNKHLIMLLGEGGIGKTALFRKIYNAYKDESHIAIARLDYSQSNFQSVSTVGDSFMMQMLENKIISESNLQVFRDKIQLSHQNFIEEQNSKRGEELELDAYFFLINTFNKNLTDKRLLILSDSVDVSFNLEQESRINILGSELHNVVIVLAGRPEPRLIHRFNIEHPDIYTPKGWKVHGMYFLKAFTTHQTAEYFNKLLPSPLKPELIETIHILTEGKPILLALTIEWFKHNVQLPHHINKSKEELEKLTPFELRRVRKRFEMALVGRVRAVCSPLDKALLFLSFLDRRYDKRILQLALDRPMEEIEALEAQLRRMAFIRSFLDESSGLLHDEAKRLINDYAWPPYDPLHEERALLARKVIDGLYLPEIKRLRTEVAAILQDVSSVPAQVPQELLAHELEMECLDYHYRISLDEGRRYVTQLIREGVSLRKRDGMRQEITKRVGEHEAKVAVARMEIRRGQYKGVREALEGALKEESISIWYKMTLLRELSSVPVDPEEKAAYLRQAIKIAEQAKDQLEAAKIYNALGLMYRRQGLWADAEEAYRETLTRLKGLDDELEAPDERAFTLNNLAYVKLLQGELDLAESLADIALEMHQKRHNQIGIAFSNLTKGQIAEAKATRYQAVRAYRTAATLFKKLGRDQNYGQAQIRLAKDKRIDRDFEAAEALLALGLQQPPSEIRAEAERELGALYRTQGSLSEEPGEQAVHYKRAITPFEKSLETSKLKRDWYGQAQALYDLIFMGFLTDGRIDEGYAEELKGLLKKHDYTILKVHLRELEADVEYQQGKVRTAFERYIEVANSLSKRHLRKYNSVLARLTRKLFDQPPEIQKELYDYFEEIIAELPPGTRLRSSLQSLCLAFQIAY